MMKYTMDEGTIIRFKNTLTTDLADDDTVDILFYSPIDKKQAKLKASVKMTRGDFDEFVKSCKKHQKDLAAFEKETFGY